MATLEELQEELSQAKADLRWMALPTWGEANAGMIRYSNQLALIGRLQKQIQEASK